MATNDDDRAKLAETPDEIKGRRQVGWSMAAKDLAPILAFCKANDRVLTIADVAAGKTAWDVISELMEERYAEIERGE